MKLCVFGADGRTGVEVVKYAASRGHDVVAFVYSDNSRRYFPEGTVVRQGDVMDYERVAEAVRGTDAVISVLGHIKGSDPRMQTRGMANIVRAMKSAGVRRVLSLTGTGARVEGDSPSYMDRALNFLVALVDPDRINDGIAHVKVLRESGLDYTIVRVLKLTERDEASTDYTLTTGGPAELLTSRAKVARVLVDLVSDTTSHATLPVISG